MDVSRPEATKPPAGLGLAHRLRARTIKEHARAELCGIVAAILTGTVTRPAYALYLRNLLPAYQEMERALRRHRARPGMAFLAQRSLLRARWIVADLDALAGSTPDPDWHGGTRGWHVPDDTDPDRAGFRRGTVGPDPGNKSSGRFAGGSLRLSERRTGA